MGSTDIKNTLWQKIFKIIGTDLIAARELEGIPKKITVFIGVSLSLFMIYAAVSIIPFYIFLTTYFGLTCILVFVLYPARASSPNRITAVDCLFVAATIASILYYITQFESMEDRVGMYNVYDYSFGLVAIVVSLECCRRTLGPLLPGLGVLLIIYCLYGNYFPGDLAHRGFNMPRVVEYLYSLEGIFGVICQVYANYIFLFILFGAFLTATKTGDYFIDLALSVVGRSRGGAAKVAVLGSGFIGSIVGSGSANVAITGVFTIPLMKRSGFMPHTAGALEAAASIGGHITPPVMGSVIFLLAALTHTSYVDVVMISIVPAILWYFSIYVAVHFHALHHDIQGLEEDKVPKFWDTLKKGWTFFLPILTLIVSLGLRYSPHICAVASICCMFVVAMFHKDTRFTIKSLIDTLYKGAKGSLVLGATAGAMGIILGGITFPGLAIKFSSLILSYSHNILPLAMILILIAAYILGMGMTVTPAYVVLAVLAAPAMLELGVPEMSAHLSIVWFSQSSPLTPPFCLAAFVGAGIAGANPMRTGFSSVRFGFAMYLVPFMIVYKPLLFNGPMFDVVTTIVGAFLGVAVAAITLEGYFKKHMTALERAAGCVAAGLLMFFGPLWQLLGLAICVALYFHQSRGAGRAQAMA